MVVTDAAIALHHEGLVDVGDVADGIVKRSDRELFVRGVI